MPLIEHGKNINKKMPVLAQQLVNNLCNLLIDHANFALDLAPVSKPSAPKFRGHGGGVSIVSIVEIHGIFIIFGYRDFLITRPHP